MIESVFFPVLGAIFTWVVISEGVVICILVVESENFSAREITSCDFLEVSNE